MGEPAFQHHPTLKEEDGNGLYCFMDQTRVCNNSCMSWTETPKGPDFQDQQFSNCLLLVNAHRAGKHLVVLANAITNLERRQGLPTIPKVG